MSGSAPGLAEQLHLAVLAAYDRMLGLDLEHLVVDGCITKAPCGGQSAGPSPVDRRKQGLKRSVATEASGILLAAVAAPANHRDDGLLTATLDTLGVVGPLPARRWCTWMPATTTSGAGKCWPNTGWPPRSPPVGAGTHPGRPPVGGRAHPCLRQPGRQAALVHRAPPAGGGVLAGAGQRGHRRWPAAAPGLDSLPLAESPSLPPMTAIWCRP